MKITTEIIVIALIMLTFPRQPQDVLLPITHQPSQQALEREQRVVSEDDQSPAKDDEQATSNESAQEQQAPFQQQQPPQEPEEKIVGSNIVTKDGKQYPLRTYKPLLAPNDPSYNQWWTQSINLDEAWDTPVGSNQTLLAIIDTGFGLNHEEFAGRWYENNGEKGVVLSENASDLNCTDQALPLTEACNNIDDNSDGINDNESAVSTTIENPSRLNCTDQVKILDKSCNLIDDDGNGLVDDWRGWDFINHDRSVQAGEMNAAGSGTHHGTYVAGAAAATGNNGTGMAGVDWSTKILPLQALDDDSYGHTLSIARSIRYATAMGADVISISLGSVGQDPFLRSEIAEAIASGTIVVAATGNGDEDGNACDCILYPANYPEVVAVGASTSSNLPASFSNYGANLDVLAPGVGILTTNWTSSNQTNAYASVSGTSLATPIVSGLLTRMRSYQADASAQQMIAALQEQTNRLTLSSNQPRSNTLGFGKIIADAAMQRVSNLRTIEQLTGFGSVSYGGSFENNGVNEVGYDCSLEDYSGTTPLHTLLKGTQREFTFSEVERQNYKEQGYSSSVLGYFCLTLPDDTATTVRNINPHREFFNSNYKD